MDDSKTLRNIEDKLSALIGLIVNYSDIEKGKEKAEVILFNAGLPTAEISKLTKKKLPAIQKSIQRSKKNG